MNTKTIEEFERIKAAVLAECEKWAIKKGRHYIHDGIAVEVEVGGFVLSLTTKFRRSHLCEVQRSLDAADPSWQVAYSVWGIEARDAANEVSEFLYIDINRLKDELKDSEARAAKLVEAVKKEINNLHWDDYAISVGESLERALAAHKEGGANG